MTKNTQEITVTLTEEQVRRLGLLLNNLPVTDALDVIAAGIQLQNANAREEVAALMIREALPALKVIREAANAIYNRDNKPRKRR